MGIGVIIAIWRSLCFFLPPIRLPRPETILYMLPTTVLRYPKIEFLGGGGKGFAPHIWYTTSNVLIGVVIGSPIAIGIGLLMMWNTKVFDILIPPINMLRSIPSLALVPLLIIFLGPSSWGHRGLVSFYCFLMVIINTLNAIRNVPPIYGEFSYTLGASRGQIYRKVIMPAIVPELVGGVRVAMGVSWSIAVVAELMGSSYGVGKLFLIFIPYFDIKGTFVGILWVLIIAVIIDMIFLRFSRFLIRWKPEKK